MNISTNFEIQQYTNLIIGFETACEIRDITETIYQISLFNPDILIFEN